LICNAERENDGREIAGHENTGHEIAGQNRAGYETNSEAANVLG